MKSLRILYMLLLVSLTIGVNSGIYAQGTAEDYKRSSDFVATIRGKVTDVIADATWIKGQPQVLYVHTDADGKHFMTADAKTRQKGPAFNHQRLADSLAASSGASVQASQLPFNQVQFVDSVTWSFGAYGKLWKLNTVDYTLQADTVRAANRPSGRGGYWGESRDDRTGDAVDSPDGVWVAYIREYNVYVAPKGKSSEAVQMTFDGSPGMYYAATIRWSPDSEKLGVTKVVPGTPRTLHLLESSPADQLQPRLQTRNYTKPGDALAQYYPVLIHVGSRTTFPVDPASISEQYSLSALSWREDSRAFTFEYNQRGHQRYVVFSVDASTGATTALIDERSPTFIHYSGKRYRKDLNDGEEIIWASERDGWNHLYMYDGLTGAVKRQITKGNWVVRKVVHVDEAQRFLIFEGSGREADQDPYLIHYYRVNFDGSGLTALTWEHGSHKAIFSPDFAYFVDTYSRVDRAPVSVLRSAKDGQVLQVLAQANTTDLEATGWRSAEVFSAKGRDGETDIWGIIVRPSNFDPAKSYPVIEYIYAGPHDSFVPKEFSTNPSSLIGLAELGFIVVQIDGMGTSNRSKAFHDICWQNLKDAGFPDRIAWMRSAAEIYPYMDLERVGIYGTSAGGQSSTGALLFHPEFYKVAVSSCGCHDNRMDKIWWNEQWMGYPIGPHYAESSNVVNAHQLQGKLMLIVGELDDNVDPASTYQLVNALIRANKDHEFIMVPGMGHASGGTYGERKRRDFFVKHLLGVTPPAWD